VRLIVRDLSQELFPSVFALICVIPSSRAVGTSTSSVTYNARRTVIKTKAETCASGAYVLAMKEAVTAKPVERLFPFVLRSRILLVGRETLLRSKSKLHFVLITTDLSENSCAEILSEFAHYPIVQHYQTEDLEKHFGLKGAKVIGFAKSGLAQSIYAELKQHRINLPPKQI
jgi:hypothetical protein